MPNRYECKMPDGRTGKRTSATRTYTHAIVGRHSEAAYLRSVEYIGRDLDHWKYVAKCAATPDNESDSAHTRGWRARDRQLIAAYPDINAYALAMVAERMAEYVNKKAAGYFAEFHTLSWAGSSSLSVDRVAEFSKHGHFDDVQAVPAELQMPKAKKGVAS